jgi:asparagine synthase (glutamine-hydrolysing)
MCGIVAMFSEGGEVRLPTLEAATQALHHRGPDAQKQWLDTRRQVGLGHARLSIIDLEGGTQPLVNEDESIHAVVNGELYDFERLRRELEAQGHRFRTQSDSEVLIHLYEQHGMAMVQHLRGEFAFVLYDARDDLLIAGRDRFGIKPLVFARHAGVLMLALRPRRSSPPASLPSGTKSRSDRRTCSAARVKTAPSSLECTRCRLAICWSPRGPPRG